MLGNKLLITDSNLFVIEFIRVYLHLSKQHADCSLGYIDCTYKVTAQLEYINPVTYKLCRHNWHKPSTFCILLCACDWICKIELVICNAAMTEIQAGILYLVMKGHNIWDH